MGTANHLGNGCEAVVFRFGERIGRDGPGLRRSNESNGRVIEPMPRSAAGWQQLLSDLASRYARVTLENRSRILSQP
jgi:hypothetical protein